MLRQKHGLAGVEGVRFPRRNRKRGCSSSSSASSKVLSFRFSKRAILAGKSRSGVLGSRSATPVPIWRTTHLKNATDSPKYSQSGKSTRPVSARRLAASLWEMNEIPSPRISEKQNRRGNGCKGDKLAFGFDLHSGSNSLLDHSHSPSASERLERPAKGIHGRARSISERLQLAEKGGAGFDSISRNSFMEVERRSYSTTSNGSVCEGSKSRLKDISNALTTSKELVKIISNLSARADQSLSGLSVISALHAELERARLQVNCLVQEQRKHRNEITYLMKQFAEERASWRSKEHHSIEAAVRAVSNELEVERKLRRKLESLNKKLGNELAEMKHSFFETVKELESEKRTREITEQMCDELARNVDEDRAGQIESCEEPEKETQNSVDVLHDEKQWRKMSQTRNRIEEKNSAISKLRKQLELFLGVKRGKDSDKPASLSRPNIRSSQNEHNMRASDCVDLKGQATGSEIHSFETKARNSEGSQTSHRAIPLQRSVSDVVEMGNHLKNQEAGINVQSFLDSMSKPPRRSHTDKSLRQKVATGFKNVEHLSSSAYQQAAESKSRLSNVWEGEMVSRRGMW